MKKNSKRYSCECSINEFILDKVNDERNLNVSSDSDFKVYVDPDIEKISYEFYIKKLTDGLPIIPPTKDRVNKFLEYTDRKPNEVIAKIPPKMGKATIEKIAINSVMAGCLPIFMPIIQNSIFAISEEKFNLPAINTTTHPVSICIINNGPVSHEVDLNCDTGCLGPGSLSNASIGRALRLILFNIGGAIPGFGDFSTMGSPSKYSFCFGENEIASPWEPLHVERGFNIEISTTTLMAVDSPQNVNDHRSKKAEDLLDTIVHTASVAGCNNSHVPGEILIIMGTEHANMLADQKWDKQDVKEYIHENASVPADLGDRGGRKLNEKWIDDGDVKITRNPDDVVLVVAGGFGRHSMIAHSFGKSSESITLNISLVDGTAISSVLDFKD
jgi:hypothetical protein